MELGVSTHHKEHLQIDMAVYLLNIKFQTKIHKFSGCFDPDIHKAHNY